MSCAHVIRVHLPSPLRRALFWQQLRSGQCQSAFLTGSRSRERHVCIPQRHLYRCAAQGLGGTRAAEAARRGEHVVPEHRPRPAPHRRDDAALRRDPGAPLRELEDGQCRPEAGQPEHHPAVLGAPGPGPVRDDRASRRASCKVPGPMHPFCNDCTRSWRPGAFSRARLPTTAKTAPSSRCGGASFR